MLKIKDLVLKEYNKFSSEVIIPIRKLGSAALRYGLCSSQEDVMVFGKEI